MDPCATRRAPKRLHRKRRPSLTMLKGRTRNLALAFILLLIAGLVCVVRSKAAGPRALTARSGRRNSSQVKRGFAHDSRPLSDRVNSRKDQRR